MCRCASPTNYSFDDAARDAGLVGDDHDPETGLVEYPYGVHAEREKDEPLEAIEVAGLFNEGPVAIEKNGAPHAGRPARWRVTELSTVSTSILFMHR